MSENKPSYQNSTLAQLAIISVAAYICAASVGLGYVLLKGSGLTLLIQALKPFEWLVVGFGMSYLTARKTNG